MDMRNVRKPKSAYEQLSNADKRFLSKVHEKLVGVGKEVTLERLAGIMLYAREEMKTCEYQNGERKLSRQLNDLGNPGSAKVAFKLQQKVIHDLYVEDGEENPFES